MRPDERRRPAGGLTAEQTAEGLGTKVPDADDLAERRARVAAYKARAVRPDPSVADQLRSRREAALRLPAYGDDLADPLDLGAAS